VRVIDIVIGAGWILFWLYWLVAAVGVKTGHGRLTQFAGWRVGIVVVVLLLLRLRVLKGHASIGNPVLQGVGLAVFALGLGLAVWARRYLGRNWGMPMSEKSDPELVRTGPYRFVRHPIYSGIILGMVGTAVAVSVYWLVAVALLGLYFVYSAVVEERTMTKRFPGAYPEYKRSTKMLIPFVF